MFRIHPASVALGIGLFAAGGLCAAHFQAPVAAATASDGPQVVETSNLPEPVQATVRKYYGKLEGCKATLESDEGVVVYEIEGKGPEGKGLDMKVVANGQVFEIEREVGPDALPPEAQANIAKAMPGAAITKIEAVEMRYYGVQLTTKDGKQTEIAVGASGRVSQDEEGDEEGEEGEEDEGH